MVDFSGITTGSIFAFPSPFHFGMLTFEIAAIISMFIVVLVILVETSADILAIALNLLFNHLKVGNSDQQSVFVAGTEDRSVRPVVMIDLYEGDYFTEGKLFDCDDKEIPVSKELAHH